MNYHRIAVGDPTNDVPASPEQTLTQSHTDRHKRTHTLAQNRYDLSVLCTILTKWKSSMKQERVCLHRCSLAMTDALAGIVSPALLRGRFQPAPLDVKMQITFVSEKVSRPRKIFYFSSLLFSQLSKETSASLANVSLILLLTLNREIISSPNWV